MTRTTSRRITTTLVAAAATAAMTACTSSNGPTTPVPDHMTSTGSTSAAPAPPGTPAAGPHNRADSMFAMMMIPHHAQAIEMSNLLFGKAGIDSRVTALAQQVKDAQAPEIVQMRGWLAGWGEPAPPTDASMHGSGHGGMPGMGMLSDAEMAALRNASGAEAQRLFLTGMIEHHEGAIEMAQDVLDDGSNPDVQALARRIVTSQQAEITTMRQLLGR